MMILDGDEFRITLTSTNGEMFTIGLDARTALRLWQDLGRGLEQWAENNVARLEAAALHKAGEIPAAGEQAH